MGLHLLKVTLNADGTLDVADNGGLKVSASSAANVVVWSLNGAPLKDAVFADPDPQETGFTWIDTQVGVFSKPLRSANQRRLILEDNHWGSATKGKWVYLLRVGIADANGKLRYHTTISRSGKRGEIRTTNNPIIINH